MVEFDTKEWQMFKKRPVVVKAQQTDEKLIIPTLEGDMIADPGDWIIQGIKGEFYPCKPDIFEKSYDIYEET